MCRWLEEAGAILGATIVEAMRWEALATAFCIATDATGILVQPTPRPDGKRPPCRRAHFFVQIADADHVFFEYTPIETSVVVSELFRGRHGISLIVSRCGSKRPRASAARIASAAPARGTLGTRP